ncbi:MAG: peptidoglycan DD-metalloendopeptidase family protein [Ignavibacteria bacterium]|nr:peptidoglycan DD-metalloendopeptidase family protein [Ignavibacteria bacterium]
MHRVVYRFSISSALVFTLLAFLVHALPATPQSPIAKQKRELQRLRQSIEQTQQKIDALSRTEHTTRRALSSYQWQRHRIATFIAQLEVELSALKDSAVALQLELEATRASLDVAEKAYSNASYNMLRWKAEHKGLTDASVRYDAFFRQLSTSLASYRNEMTTLKDSLTSQENLLEEYATTQQNIMDAKSQEQKNLSASIVKSSTELNRIRSDKTSLTKQLEERRKSVAKLRSMISKLVAEEARRASERAARKKTSGSTQPPPITSAVSGYPGRSLPWPTRSHSILQGYGTYTNPTTGTVLDNPGIDIKTPSGSEVKSVAPGDVSSVTFLPGFGSLVIVDHGNGIRSVYANLSSVSVTKGSKISEGSRIGTSGENIDGELLHFELWNGRSRQNPTIYLR